MSSLVDPRRNGPSADPAAAAVRLKASFDDVYRHPDPRPYFRVLGDLGYVEAAHMHRVVDALLGHFASPATVLDLCCSYGVLGVLLRTDLTYGDLAARYRAPAVATWSTQRLVDEDRDYLARHRRAGSPVVHGVDVSEPAVAYARQTTAIADGYADDLEARAPSAMLRRVLSSVDVVTVAGGIGYVTERTFDRLLSSAGSTPPWILALVVRTYPYDRIASCLADHGLATERLTRRTFARRRFVDAAEQRAVLSHLEALGIDPAGREADGWYHADLYVSRPVSDARCPIDSLLAGL